MKTPKVTTKGSHHGMIHGWRDFDDLHHRYPMNWPGRGRGRPRLPLGSELGSKNKRNGFFIERI
jgi:hypothetical protein